FVGPLDAFAGQAELLGGAQQSQQAGPGPIRARQVAQLLQGDGNAVVEGDRRQPRRAAVTPIGLSDERVTSQHAEPPPRIPTAPPHTHSTAEARPPAAPPLPPTKKQHNHSPPPPQAGKDFFPPPPPPEPRPPAARRSCGGPPPDGHPPQTREEGLVHEWTYR